MAKINIKESAILAAFVTLAMTVLNLVLGYIGKPMQALFSIKDIGAQLVNVVPTPVSPISATIGNKVLAWLGGYVPIGTFFTEAILVLFVSAFVTILAGNFFYGVLNLSVKGKVGRIASVILLGAVAFYLLLVGLVGITTNTIIGLAIYTVAAAYITGWIAGIMKINV